MQVTSRWSRLVVTVFALALPFKAGGCGRTACITVTPSQLQGGACPGSAAAQARFSGQGCGGPMVEGPGILDDGLCCYPVAVSTDDVDCSGNGGGSAGAFSAETSTTGGVGGAGGAGGGATCDQALDGAPFTQVNVTALPYLQSLEVCACTGTCLTICDPTLCVGNALDSGVGNAPDNGCLTCLRGNCATQLMNCQGH